MYILGNTDWLFGVIYSPQVLISRGLQLEGQVVTEEQDLQVMVMTNQKSSPVRYLHASAMQDRVRAAVTQSQAS